MDNQVNDISDILLRKCDGVRRCHKRFSDSTYLVTKIKFWNVYQVRNEDYCTQYNLQRSITLSSFNSSDFSSRLNPGFRVPFHRLWARALNRLPGFRSSGRYESRERVTDRRLRLGFLSLLAVFSCSEIADLLEFLSLYSTLSSCFLRLLIKCNERKFDFGHKVKKLFVFFLR